MIQSFREYLLHNTRENEFPFFARSHFKHLFEFAQHKEQLRFPVGIDNDDIEFLQQFDAGGAVKDLYTKALKQRYDMLFDALERRHQMLVELGYDQFIATIVKALRNQTRADWNALGTFEGPLRMSAKQITELQTKYPKSETESLTDDQLHQNAEQIAFRHARRAKDLEHIADDSKFETFNFPAVEVDIDTGKQKGARHTSEQIQMKAKPFLNRLYHKLEQDVGATHITGSGLTGAGKYGFGLHEPVRSIDPRFGHMTQGMKFPTEKQISERVRDFLNHQSHRTFGRIPENEKIVWKKVQGEDRETIRFHKEKLVKQFYDQLFGTFQHYKQTPRSSRSEEAKSFLKKYPTPAAMEKEARRLANNQLKEDVKQNKVFGPPIPGVEPQGFQPKLVSGEKRQFIEKLLVNALTATDESVREDAWNKLLWTQQGGVVPQRFAFPKKKIKELKQKYSGYRAAMTESSAKLVANQIAEEHFNQTTKDGKKKLSDFDQNENFTNPPLYLPHMEKEVEDENGNKTKKLVPFMLPFKFYRMIGRNPKKDYVREPVLDSKGQPVYDKKGRPKMKYKLTDDYKLIPAHPEDSRHGWHKMFVHDGEDNPYKKDIQRDGALDFNHNTKKLKGLAEGSPEWKQAFQKAFGSQGKVKVSRFRGKWTEKPAANDDKTAFYKDIWEGVKRCIESESCGGRKSDYEIKRMRENYRELYHLVYLTAMQGINLKELETSKGRVSWSQRATSEYGAKNWGRGSRRLRILDDRNKKKWTPIETQHSGKGEKKLDIRGLSLPYRNHALRKYLSRLQLMQSQAQAIDSQSKQLEEMPEPDNNERSLLSSFQALKNKRENFDDAVVEFLATLDALVNNKPEEQAIADAEALVSSWMEEGHLNASMIKKIEQLDLYHAARELESKAGYKPEIVARDTGEPGEDLKDEAILARNIFMNDVHEDLAKHNDDMNAPEIRTKYMADLPSLSQYVRTLLKQKLVTDEQWLGLEENKLQLDKVLNMTQQFINNYFNDPASAQTAREMAAARMQPQKTTAREPSAPAAAAKPQSLASLPKPPGDYTRYIHLKTPQARYYLSHDPEFLEDATVDQLQRLHSYWKDGQFQEADKQSAMKSIESELQKRGINV